MNIHFHHAIPNNPGIAIIALSGCVLNGVEIERGLQVLRNIGLRVFNYYDHQQKFQRFGATDSERLRQLSDALDNPDVHMIMALRGSYGLSRILPKIDFNRIAQSGKLLIGYSDFNALQLAMLAKTGTASLCGHMLWNDFIREDLRSFTQEQFVRSIYDRKTLLNFETDSDENLDCTGILWGGNLAIICHLVGTEYFPNIDDGILFLEDVGEHPYRVERMMLQLHFAGILQHQKAIIFGSFSSYGLAPHDNGYNFEAMIAYLRQTISTPIITGLPFGHCDDKASLLQGSLAHLSVLDRQVSLSASF